MSDSTGAVTVTETRFPMVKLIKFDWITGSGSQDHVATGFTAFKDYDGQVIELVTCPDSTAAPDANYDLTITDKNSLDVLVGSGANRHTTTTEYVRDGTTGTVTKPLGCVAGSSLTINITDAGTSKKGLAYLFIR